MARCFQNGHAVPCPEQAAPDEERPAEQLRNTTVEATTVVEPAIWALRPGFFFQDIRHKENENVVRARAGLLNLVAATMFMLILISLVQQEAGITPWKDLKNVLTPVAAVVLSDFALGSVLGLCASPTGIVGTLVSVHVLRQKPIWVSSRPKRFAWTLGIGMVLTCLLLNLLVEDYRVKKPLILVLVSACLVLTWLEASLGLCVGCKMFGAYYDWLDRCEAKAYAKTAARNKSGEVAVAAKPQPKAPAAGRC